MDTLILPLFIVLLFLVPALLLFGVEWLERRIWRWFPLTARWLFGGFAPLHALAVVAFAAGCWISWTHRLVWSHWEFAVPPLLCVAVVYAGLFVAGAIASPPDAVTLVWRFVQLSYARIRGRNSDRAA